MWGHRIVGKVLQPSLAFTFVGEKFQVKRRRFFAAVAEQLNVTGGVLRGCQQLSVFAQGIRPEMRIKLAVTKMVGLIDEYSEKRQFVDDLPQLGC